MKGIIFNVTEKAVVELLGEDAWDDLLDAAELDGDYTALGTYPDDELIALVVAAAEKTGHDAGDVQRLIGRHALANLVATIEDFVDLDSHVFDFLSSIHGIIHVEVKKLDPASRPPDIEPRRISETELHLHYKSERGLSPLAEGLILGAGDLFKTPLEVDVVSQSPETFETVLAVRLVDD